jgi:hypothetical protein
MPSSENACAEVFVPLPVRPDSKNARASAIVGQGVCGRVVPERPDAQVGQVLAEQAL